MEKVVRVFSGCGFSCRLTEATGLIRGAGLERIGTCDLYFFLQQRNEIGTGKFWIGSCIVAIGEEAQATAASNLQLKGQLPCALKESR